MSSNTGAIQNNRSRINIKTMVQIGMLSGIAVILMLFEIPLWFAPGFYKMDISEVPVLIGCFVMGPVAGVIIEAIKILLNFVLNGTTTAGIGELSNFIVGCAFIVPAGILYRRRKTKKMAVAGLIVGTVIMVAIGCFVNAFVLLPVYSAAFGMPLDALIGMGSAVNPAIKGLPTFVMLAVAPFNLLKGVLVSVLTLILYKYISPILKKNHE